MKKKTKRNPIAKDTAILVSALKTLGTEIEMGDLIDLTKNDIQWGSATGNKFRRLYTEAGGEIVRVQQGIYAHKDHTKAKNQPEHTQHEEHTQTEENTQKEHLEPTSTHVLKEYKSDLGALYKPNVGDDFFGVVTGVEDYGVFLENENRVSGLLHRTKMKTGGAPMGFMEISKYFRIGDHVHAKVAEVLVNKGGRLSLTTMGMPLPRTPNGELQAQTTVMPTEKITQEVQKEQPNTMNEKEIEQLVTYLKGKVGVVSPAAKVRLRELASEHGMFTLMMAFAKAVESFEVDMSLLFVKELESKMGDSL